MLNKNLVLLSYGNEFEYCRAVFCILSFSAWHEDYNMDTRIVVYTDHPLFFKKHLPYIDIQYFHLTKELLKELKGAFNFNHRLKVAAIDLTFKQYPDEDLLFIDTDTFFYTSAIGLMNGLVKGESFMHRCEYTLEESLPVFSSYGQSEYPLAFLEYIHGRDFSVGGSLVKFSKNDYNWNSGVIGITKDMAHYMPEIFALTEAFYENSKWFISEQLAFSLLLQYQTKVKPADQYILHYWGKAQKNLLDKLIGKWLHEYSQGKPIDTQLIRSTTIRWKKAVETDMITEQAVAAYKSGSWYFLSRKLLQLILTDPKSLPVSLSAFRKSD